MSKPRSDPDPIAADRQDALASIPVDRLTGVGPRMRERLARLGIQSVQDLLFHLPVRYQDRTRLVRLCELRPGVEALVEGEVMDTQLGFGRRRSLKVSLAEASGPGGGLLLRFFHFSPQQSAALQPGVRLRCYGEVRQGPKGLEMIHPEYRIQGPGAGSSRGEPSLTPIYPSTEGLQQRSWRALTDRALGLLEACPPADYLPAESTLGLGLPGLAEALRYLHRPPPGASLPELLERRHPAFVRLAFEELVAHQISLRRLRRVHGRQSAPALRGAGLLGQRLRERLPFALTGDQERVVAEISADLNRPHPMQRMLQGDVGSGKTVVAALAALQAIEGGCQVALMAPTELLSEQHWRGLSRWLRPLEIEPQWLTGRHVGRGRTASLEAIASGAARLVIGTHALFQEEVRFQDLGLVIIDEQHRFGVHQRLSLREKGGRGGAVPHQLIMTATPIPRSLAMTLYADLDLSVITQTPPGRRPVTTVAIPEGRREEVIERVRGACALGRQAYWVCTLIEESEDSGAPGAVKVEAQAAQTAFELLTEQLPGVRVGLVHGRMKPAEKQAAMAAFKAGDIQLLVATTVIEVGVDVPNASVMVVENAERFGLSQLHQLRGRVGRGAEHSYCILMTGDKLGNDSRTRINTMVRTQDGFEISEVDLRLRGPGDLMGTQQSGIPQLHLADLVQDADLLQQARRTAQRLLDEDPELRHPGNAPIAAALQEQMKDRAVWGRIG